jgi:DNA-binding PadR family transcriptional regulator
MTYDPESQARYNLTEKGKARKRKWAANMTPEQQEKQREAKRLSARKRRAREKEDK